MSGRHFARSAGLIGLATLASRVLGLVRDVAQAAYFATGAANEAFVVATRFPSLLRDLFAEGAMSAAFVPTLTRYREQHGPAAAWRLGSQVVNGLMVVTGIIVILGIVFADQLAAAYAGNFSRTPGKLELTVRLTRLNMPFLLLIAVAAAFMGMLNSLKRFAAPAAAPALYNVVFIVCTVGLTPLFMRVGIEPVMALTAGFLLGGVAQVAAQWPAVRREGYRHQWVLNPSDPGLRQILILMGPGTVGAAAAQVNLFVNTSLATGDAGAVSALNYAFRLMYMPIGIVGVAIATAAIPDLARHAAGQAHAEMRRTVSQGVRLMLMLSVPATLGLMVLAPSIVELIYQHGAFTSSDTIAVATALVFYAPGIIGYSVVKLASPSFYSLHDARTPLVVSVVAIAANLFLNLWLNSIMGFAGLALGTSIAANINAGLLLVLLSRRIGGVDGSRLARSFAKIFVASLVMAAAAYWTEAGLRRAFPADYLPHQLIRVAGGIGAGTGVLALAAWVLHIEEFREAVRRVAERLRGRQQRPPDVDLG
jgi:putative peptidoglycan lipid II flippase